LEFDRPAGGLVHARFWVPAVVCPEQLSGLRVKINGQHCPITWRTDELGYQFDGWVSLERTTRPTVGRIAFRQLNPARPADMAAETSDHRLLGAAVSRVLLRF
jgi:hypothetical protein